jgi:hypothetical protein
MHIWRLLNIQLALLSFQYAREIGVLCITMQAVSLMNTQVFSAARTSPLVLFMFDKEPHPAILDLVEVLIQALSVFEPVTFFKVLQSSARVLVTDVAVLFIISVLFRAGLDATCHAVFWLVSFLFASNASVLCTLKA